MKIVYELDVSRCVLDVSRCVQPDQTNPDVKIVDIFFHVNSSMLDAENKTCNQLQVLARYCCKPLMP